MEYKLSPIGASHVEAIWPSKWLIGIIGLFQIIDKVFAVFTPIKSEGIKPGPLVIAMAFIFLAIFLSFKAIFKSGKIFFKCSRLARLGTTPPNFAWSFIWD